MAQNISSSPSVLRISGSGGSTARSMISVSHRLEPISKSSEEDNEAGELDKAEEVLSVFPPADEYATLPLYPGEEALDEPAPLVTA